MGRMPLPVGPPEPQVPLCPHCREPLASVGWVLNQDYQLVTFFHNVPECMVALNSQFLAPMQPRRIALPSELMPGGRG